MAHLTIREDQLLLRLTWPEKAAARRFRILVPLSAVRTVMIEPDWWRALRGRRGRGVWVPEVFCVGVRRHSAGKDFVAVRPDGPVLCIGLPPSSPFSLLVVSVPDPDATARCLRDAAPNLVPAAGGGLWRSLPVPEEAPKTRD
ncbi:MULTISPECIES: hypothetical protein [unclassified Streptomyces]|uniref:hypothetical protein n=1 Tax=unclassified Streptomyces TaxID=2593676 RepID=UPI000364A41E|nr:MULTISPECIES: hypothetical protein [unclassified Streptomyces]MYT29564.1 hypothetical protein [Streptomyces sp. SID8354]